MREILFRGKRIDNREWVYGGLFENLEEGRVITYIYQFPDGAALPVIPETVGQFTGLYDINGYKVFEGDYDANYDVIAWCNNRQGWAMKADDFPTDDFMLCHCYQCKGDFEINDISMSLEIIGCIHDTIYDDPELIIRGGVK